MPHTDAATEEHTQIHDCAMEMPSYITLTSMLVCNTIQYISTLYLTFPS